ncbi:translocation/assembly module TamB domain-containing protein [Mucilaginibacter sp.]|uniref:translocation/assembly module TamB domain-containing protein n=1 Tax=Mucilaginibacter sp. TaxID=1882438 RepID=UPI002B8B43BD|nr:translocation/assembly module TamB domain-containing protein [Mucilaginibacter sp.]HTI61289.1 translocation/assembly module TamB domain-containing protein [Mucilaginibacter sp.]
MLVILLLFSIVLLVFQYKPVQTWAAKKVAQSLSDSLHTKVNINSLYLKPFTSVVLEGFYVLDKNKDTLINTPKLEVAINGFTLFSSLKQKRLDLSLIELDNASVYLKKQKDGNSNLKFIIDYFNSPPDTTKVKKPGKPWTIDFEKIVVNNLHFRYKNQKVDTLMRQVNFDDIDVKNFSAEIRDMDIVHHIFKGDIRKLTLKEEKSGFYLKDFVGRATVDTNEIAVRDMHIQTDHSDLKNYFRMKFRSFEDFDHIEDRVYMDADFKTSEISSSDIAYFADGLDKTKFDLGIDGRIRGRVNDLRTEDLLITGGQATYVKGDFNIKGLPDWNNTFMELNFEQVATNKRDLDFLYSNFSGQPRARVPDIISKFGEISFKGKFTGLQNDFVAFGTFKTALGRFDPDLNLKISKKGTPSYSGKIATSNFDLGKLLETDIVGRTSLTANVKGSGDDLKTLNTKLNAQISRIRFKSYDYNNVTFNGSLIKEVAKGELTINDRNIQLDANGSADLGSKLPAYNFAANVNNANLYVLKLAKDTITMSGNIKTDFAGNTLNNTEGKFLLSNLRIVDPRNNYVVDSVYLAASGIGDNREIVLKSDMADGSLKGNYDLATLPSYFKTIIKKYIPSLKTDIVPPNPQKFAFNLQVKNIDPFLAFFVSNLKVPDRGTFIGQFDSEKKTAVFNGYVKTIQLGSTVFHDLIIDESTNNDYLGLNLSLSSINITDSLIIKNIDVTNFLKKDSLNFNIKLADKDAANQLDLYGLVQFARDTTARLKILPSDVILEHQNWRIDNQVRVRFLNGKTLVSGFELANGGQKVKINGFISDDPADKLKVEFDKFSMTTLDQLTKAANVKMKGTLNGDVVLTSLTKAPTFDSHLAIDSFTMNKTLIGDVKLMSTLDSNRTRANVNMNIVNRGLKTMDVSGSYLLGKSSDESLDFALKMNQTESIIFEPFVKDLVSNLKGTISSDLKLTGSPADPQLNGNITLENTGVTVNYLKTAYTVNNKLNVANSVITVDNMTLKDTKGGEGIANGKVDLNDLSNPDIEVKLEAKNLMALNTTFKDNHLYFGTAYATGSFSFSGPTDNMNIDIKARTNAGTVFNIPLNTSSTAEDYEFIRYVTPNDTARAVKGPRAFHGITLNFDLSVDEKTTVKITTSYGKLEGTGTANNLKLNISSLGDFNMYGNYLITNGKFEFVAKDVVSKNFQVTQGGTIRWTGDPTNAEINMHAIYEVRTNVQNLYIAAGQTSNSAKANATVVLVQAELILTKSLLLPVIDFDFTFPTDPGIKDDLGTYLNDYNNRSQQALSVIVTRNFSSGTGNAQFTNQALTSAVNELFFTKLNSLIAHSNAIRNLDLNIRSFNDASATIHLLHDRVVLSGSLYSNTDPTGQLFYNAGSLFNSNFNNLSKDFSAQYLILKNGSLNARYSYRILNTAQTNFDFYNAQYVNALGLIYQRDFDTFGEFVRNIFHPGRRRPVNPLPEPKVTPSSPPPPTPAENAGSKAVDGN